MSDHSNRSEPEWIFFFALKTLTFALLMFPGGGHTWLFSMEDSHPSGIGSIDSNHCVLQEDPLSRTVKGIPRYNMTTAPQLS